MSGRRCSPKSSAYSPSDKRYNERRMTLKTIPGAEHPGAGEEVQKLQQQCEQERQERKNLEEKLAARERQAEQERSALETEIEQLMETVAAHAPRTERLSAVSAKN